jgi:hypothetical protein
LIQAQAQHTDHFVGQRRAVVEEGLKVGTGHLQKPEMCPGAHAGCAPALRLEEAHLSEKVAGMPDGEKALVGSAQGLDDLDLAVEDEEEAVAGVAFTEEKSVGRCLGLVQQVGQEADLSAVQPGKERDLANQQYSVCAHSRASGSQRAGPICRRAFP